jgi:hypothetical protein
MGNAYKLLVGKPEEKDHLGDTGVDGRIISQWSVWPWTRFTWLRI